MPSHTVTVIHKFLRREMFDFAERLFRAGPDQIPEIRTELERVAELLDEHARQEDARIGPLLRELDPPLADRLERDHRRLDDQLATIRYMVAGIDTASPDARASLLQLHLDWNRFLSAYLAHLDDEERTLFAGIGDRLPPLSAIAESAKQQGERGAEFLLRLWSVTTCEERAAIESGRNQSSL